MIANAQSISVDRIFLDLTNPRHKPYTSEAEVIDYLCQREFVYALAKDMAKVGLNPLELFALIPSEKSTKVTKTSPFIVAEGNRRMCAIKLLNDPDLAPAKLRKDFKRLADSTSQSFTEVLAVIFKDASQVKDWLERIHGGPQGGIGRKQWNSEQKTRHLGDRKNVLAQGILDYAENRGYISVEERKGKLTTAQRYLGNAILREAIGIESENPEVISRTRPAHEFDILIKAFMRDLVDGTVHSRSNAEDIKDYSRGLGTVQGVSANRVPAASLTSPSTSKRSKRAPKAPRRPRAVGFELEIDQALKQLGSFKLQNLYFSICDVTLEKHTPLVSIGVWSFMETLTARCGRNPSTDFPSFLDNNKLALYGFTERENRKTLSQTIRRISEYGNTTKHSDKAANFNDLQLVNDVDTLKDLIVVLIKAATP